MERKEQCERIVLTKKEKELLKQIQKNPRYGSVIKMMYGSFIFMG